MTDHAPAAPARSFDAFWLEYLRAHQNPTCRALHYVATSISMVCLVGLIVTLDWRWLLAGVIGSYGFAWAGHFFVEGNKPLAWSKPAWSLAADYRMFFLAFGGGLKSELTRASRV